MTDHAVLEMDRELDRRGEYDDRCEAARDVIEENLKNALMAGEVEDVFFRQEDGTAWSPSGVLAVAVDEDPEGFAKFIGLMLKKGDVDAQAYFNKVAGEFSNFYVWLEG